MFTAKQVEYKKENKMTNKAKKQIGTNFSVGIWNGLPDRKPARVTVVMPKEWHNKLKAIASQSGRSVNDVIGIALKNSFNFQGDKRPRGRPKKEAEDE